MDIITEKHCTKCGEIKSVKEFYKNKDCKYGLNPRCKSCVRSDSREYGKEYRKTHKEHYSLLYKAYRISHKEKRNFENRVYNARFRGAIGKFSLEQWKTLCQFYGNRCLCCNDTSSKLELDHVVPISRGGENFISNIQPLCKACNRKKMDKIIDYRPDKGEFAQILQNNSI